MITNQCVVLIGGRGTRLGALTEQTPKPLLRVGDTPFVEVLIGEALRRGFNDLLLLAGYRAEAVEEYAVSLRGRLPAGCTVRVSIEPEPLGTGGAVRHAADWLADSFLLLNGDTWFDFNWLDLFGVAGTYSALAGRRVLDSGRHECVQITSSSVTEILRRTATNGSAVVNGGVYVMRKSDFRAFSGRFSIEDDLLPTLVARSQLKGQEYDGFFLDIGLPETFENAQTSIPARRRRPAVLFDRDGVLNHDDNYVGSPDRLRWTEGAKEAVRLANDLGYYVFVVTNQAGVARGFYDEAAVRSLHRWMSDELRSEGAWIDDWRYCPYHPEASVQRYRAAHPWRKPEPGMILDLIRSWPVDVDQSILIGDQESDCAAASAAGIPSFLFPGGNLYEFISKCLPRPQR
jgi:D-glycero-D-manno-heptose 1,7-bisphosphate phosphatase